MKILYDHQAFTIQDFGGVSKCFCEMLTHRQNSFDYEISAVESNNTYLHESGLIPSLKTNVLTARKFCSQIPVRGAGRIYTGISQLGLIHTAENTNKRRSVELLEKGDFDIFHPTYFDDYFLHHLHGKPFVLTIHDMIAEIYSGRAEDRRRKRILAEKAAAIVAVSEHTKQDVVKILGVHPDQVFVVYHGGPRKETILTAPIYSFKYFLYVGVRQGYKHFNQFVKDYASFSMNHEDVKLIVTGPALDNSERRLLRSLKIDDKVTHHYASNEELKNLYAHAFAFVYPSCYEGFGMPILEAYAYGCPVILNHASCFPEIADDAAVYIHSSDNGSDTTEVLCQFYEMPDSERQALCQKGYERLERFSWEKSAEELKVVYDYVMNHNKKGE